MKEQFTPTPNQIKPFGSARPTGEAYTIRFDIPKEAANDSDADSPSVRLRKAKTERRQAREADPTLDPRNSKYTRIALSSENGLEEAIKEWKHDTAESVLFDNHILERSDDSIILTDKERLINEGWRQWSGKRVSGRNWDLSPAIQTRFNIPDSQARINLKSSDIFDCIVHLSAATKDGEVMPVTTFPDSFEQVAHGNYPDCHIKPWELALIQGEDWERPVLLADGTTTNISELCIANIIREWKITTIGAGRFSVINPNSGETSQLTTEELTRHFFSKNGYRSAVELRQRPAEYAQNYLKNLRAIGLLHPEDFRQTAARFDNSLFPPQDRFISSSPDMSLQTPGGKSMKYYLGRDRIVGTDIPFDRENLVLRYLDDRTCGLVRISGTIEEIITTFPLMPPDEVEARREATKQKLKGKGNAVTEANIASYTYAGGKEMAVRMKRYQPTQYLPQYQSESSTDYANRIARLSDIRLTSQKTRAFFRDANIGLHHLPWAEQLGASSILTDPRFNAAEILDFCKRFGSDGLRTFIAGTFGKDINREVLRFGSAAPELAAEIFRKYASILSSRDAVSETLDRFRNINSTTSEQYDATESYIIKALTTKAKGFLEEFINAYQNIASRSFDEKRTFVDSFLKRFDAVRADIELLRLVMQKEKLTGDLEVMRQIPDMSVRNMSGSELLEDQELLAQVESVYRKNFSGTDPEGKRRFSDTFIDAILTRFQKRLTDPHSRFRVISYHDEPVAFLLASEEEDQVELSALNANPAFAFTQSGFALFEEAIHEYEERGIVVTADCPPRMERVYVNEYGFQSTGEIEFAGQRLLLIRRDPKNTGGFSRDKSGGF